MNHFWKCYHTSFYILMENTGKPPLLVLGRKVPTDDRHTTLPRNLLSIEHGLLVFQDLVSKFIPDFIPAQM